MSAIWRGAQHLLTIRTRYLLYSEFESVQEALKRITIARLITSIDTPFSASLGWVNPRDQRFKKN